MAIFDVPPWASPSTVTPASDEVWQVQGGTVRLMSAAPASETDGITLSNGDAVNIKSGAASSRGWRGLSAPRSSGSDALATERRAYLVWGDARPTRPERASHPGAG